MEKNIILWMGGSSLAPESLPENLWSKEGYLDFEFG
jgi:hypothetical protein